MAFMILRRGFLPCSNAALTLKLRTESSPSFLRLFSENKSIHISSKDQDGWVALYKFPSIKYMRFLSRFKFYQMLAMAALSYPLYEKYAEGLVTDFVFYSAMAGCLGASSGFLVFSYLSMKVIGELSISNDCEKIRISRLTFNGSRCEDILDLESIVPYMDCNTKSVDESILNNLNVEQESGEKQNYYYFVRYGHVVDKRFYNYLGII